MSLDESYGQRSQTSPSPSSSVSNWSVLAKSTQLSTLLQTVSLSVSLSTIAPVPSISPEQVSQTPST